VMDGLRDFLRTINGSGVILKKQKQLGFEYGRSLREEKGVAEIIAFELTSFSRVTVRRMM
jgi:hypothetical protein